ncbi:MAG: NGG1p interacting factor NIF3, partial [Coriobacteriia bacterium]
MRLGDIYRTSVEAGIEADARSREEIDHVLTAAGKELEALPDDEKHLFDRERLTNPYDDTRICVGDEDLEVRGLITGIDMAVGEVVLADRLRERG